MERLCAVVPNANRNPSRIEELPDVVGVNSVNRERHKPDSFDASVSSEDCDTVDLD